MYNMEGVPQRRVIGYTPPGGQTTYLTTLQRVFFQNGRDFVEMTPSNCTVYPLAGPSFYIYNPDGSSFCLPWNTKLELSPAETPTVQTQELRFLGFTQDRCYRQLQPGEELQYVWEGVAYKMTNSQHIEWIKCWPTCYSQLFSNGQVYPLRKDVQFHYQETFAHPPVRHSLNYTGYLQDVNLGLLTHPPVQHAVPNFDPSATSWQNQLHSGPTSPLAQSGLIPAKSTVRSTEPSPTNAPSPYPPAAPNTPTPPSVSIPPSSAQSSSSHSSSEEVSPQSTINPLASTVRQASITRPTNPKRCSICQKDKADSYTVLAAIACLDCLAKKINNQELFMGTGNWTAGMIKEIYDMLRQRRPDSKLIPIPNPPEMVVCCGKDVPTGYPPRGHFVGVDAIVKEDGCPQGHVLCKGCANKLTNCPICNEFIYYEDLPGGCPSGEVGGCATFVKPCLNCNKKWPRKKRVPGAPEAPAEASAEVPAEAPKEVPAEVLSEVSIEAKADEPEKAPEKEPKVEDAKEEESKDQGPKLEEPKRNEVSA